MVDFKSMGFQVEDGNWVYLDHFVRDMYGTFGQFGFQNWNLSTNESGRTNICQKLLTAMVEGVYEISPLVKVIWDVEAQPFKLTEGRERTTDSKILWALDKKSNLWYGFEMFWMDGRWYLLQPNARFKAMQPDDFENIVANPCWESVTEELYFRVLSEIIHSSRVATNFNEFIEIFGESYNFSYDEYDEHDFTPDFGVIKLENGKIGYVYSTYTSDRDLVYVPDEQKVYTRNMKASERFLEFLSSHWGEPISPDTEPEWFKGDVIQFTGEKSDFLQQVSHG